MADTVALFADGVPQSVLRGLIEKCTGLSGLALTERPGEVVLFEHVDFDVRLGRHWFVSEDGLDYESYEHWVTADDYAGREDPEASEVVAWFRDLFACLRAERKLSLLLVYNLESVLDQYAPGR